MEQKKKVIKLAIAVVVLFALLCVLLFVVISWSKSSNSSKENSTDIAKLTQPTSYINVSTENTSNNRQNTIVNTPMVTPNKNAITTNGVSNFDLSFLKMDNNETNMVYSPLSIKYALKMLEDGANGESRRQIAELLGNYNLTKYTSNSNMSLANVLVVKNSIKNNIKEDFVKKLQEKYNAEVMFDSFENPDNINSWVSERTLNLINNILPSMNPELNFLLINALGIDMEWKQKFLSPLGVECRYEHEKYENEVFGWVAPYKLKAHNFDGISQEVSGMDIIASINNYDIVNVLGEEYIRKTVGDAYREWFKEKEYAIEEVFGYDNVNGKMQPKKVSSEEIEEEIARFLNVYIPSINENYHRVDVFSDFSLYIDNNVKAFAKDLKEYNGTTLQYIGIMPNNDSLDNFITKTDETQINSIISNLKELKSENFKEGVITKITGYIPKFKFEYNLELKESLQRLGVTDVFEQEKSDLTNMVENANHVYIDDTLHKANIEFTQDGIKAAAVSLFGGSGAGGAFDYFFEVPVEEIDLTFDKSYMYIIRDKETGEVWFTGRVYEPLLWENEPDRDEWERNY